MARIDPTSGKILSTVKVVPGTYGFASAFGALWITGFEDGSLVRIDPSTESAQTFHNVGAQLVDVAQGPGGLWISDHGTAQVILFNPLEDRIIRSFPDVEGHLVPYGSGMWVIDPIKHELALLKPDGSRGRVIELPYGDGLTLGHGRLWLSAGTTSLGFIAPP